MLKKTLAQKIRNVSMSFNANPSYDYTVKINYMDTEFPNKKYLIKMSYNAPLQSLCNRTQKFGFQPKASKP